MRPLSSTVLALFFVSLMLLSLLSVKPTWERGPVALSDDGARISEVGLRVTLQR